MRKKTFLIKWLLVIAVNSILNINAVAQNQPLDPQMQKNLHDMSALMTDISRQLSTGKMSPDAQRTAASVTKQVSQILQELSGLGSGIHHDHKRKIEKAKKAWNPWGEDTGGGGV